MTSISKKRKAKNSHIYNGGEKPNGLRLKRIQYFTKQERLQNKRRIQEYIFQSNFNFEERN